MYRKIKKKKAIANQTNISNFKIDMNHDPLIDNIYQQFIVDGVRGDVNH